MSSEAVSLVTSPTSGEALVFLRMVTAGFYDKSIIGLSMFQALGEEFDQMKQWSEELRAEIFPQTCTWSVSLWEERYGIYSDETLSLQGRRAQILNKMLHRAPINPATLARFVETYTQGEEVLVEDFVAPYTFQITVKNPKSDTDLFGLWQYIYQIKPSHLAFRLYISREIVVEHQLHSGLHSGTFIQTELQEITEQDWLDSLGKESNK